MRSFERKAELKIAEAMLGTKGSKLELGILLESS
jgi:hypothetical protein